MDATHASHRVLRRRRAHARFEAALRVEYEIKKQRVLSLSRSLSAGGMLLGNTTNLQLQAELDFSILLPDTPRDPLRVRGKVVGVTRRGAQVQFDTGQTQASLRIRRYVAAKVIPVLSEEVARPDAALKRVLELAELLVDFGRTDEAMTVYRSKVLILGRERAFAENMAVLWLEQINAAPEIKRQPLLTELQDLCRRAELLTDSDVLKVARERVEGKPGVVSGAPPPIRRVMGLGSNDTVPHLSMPGLGLSPVAVQLPQPVTSSPAEEAIRALRDRLAALEGKLQETTQELHRERTARQALEEQSAQEDIFDDRTVLTPHPDRRKS